MGYAFGYYEYPHLLEVTINYQTPLPKGVILCRCVDSAGHNRL